MCQDWRPIWLQKSFAFGEWYKVFYAGRTFPATWWPFGGDEGARAASRPDHRDGRTGGKKFKGRDFLVTVRLFLGPYFPIFTPSPAAKVLILLELLVAVQKRVEKVSVHERVRWLPSSIFPWCALRTSALEKVVEIVVRVEEYKREIFLLILGVIGHDLGAATRFSGIFLHRARVRCVEDRVRSAGVHKRLCNCFTRFQKGHFGLRDIRLRSGRRLLG